MTPIRDPRRLLPAPPPPVALLSALVGSGKRLVAAERHVAHVQNRGVIALPSNARSLRTTIVSVSGGLGSAYALSLVLNKYTNVAAVFADTKGTGDSHFWSDLPVIENLLHERFGGETQDTYRFLWQLSYALDIPIERLENGRTIWSVAGQYKAFRLVIGKKFFCKASEILKREVIAQYIEKNYRPGSYRLALGMGVLEPHRIKNAQEYWRWRLGWNVEVFSPLIEDYELTGIDADNCDLSAWATSIGLEVPAAYPEGFSHNNDSGICFNAAQTHFYTLHERRPLHYSYAAWQEYRVPKFCGFSATILKDERGGKTKPMSLYQFEKRIEVGDVNLRDTGLPCACNVYVPMKDYLQQQPLFAP